MKKYIAITIGRNVGDQPMDTGTWVDFEAETFAVVAAHTKVDGQIFMGEGVGIWGYEHEDAHAIIVLADKVDEPALRADLAKLANKYHQDAIGCAILDLPNGDESLVFADK